MRRAVPARMRDGAWGWRLFGRDERGWTWWNIVPERLQKWWVRSHNARFCARFGHEDIQFHLAEGGYVSAPKCGNCSTPLASCTGYGFHHRAVSDSTVKEG